jgi:pyruvate-formate lyase
MVRQSWIPGEATFKNGKRAADYEKVLMAQREVMAFDARKNIRALLDVCSDMERKVSRSTVEGVVAMRAIRRRQHTLAHALELINQCLNWSSHVEEEI